MTDREHDELVDKIGEVVWRLTLRSSDRSAGMFHSIHHGLSVGLPPPPNPAMVWDGLCRSGVIRPEHPKAEVLAIMVKVYRHLKLPCPEAGVRAIFDIP